MSKLLTQKQSSWLRTMTALCPVKRNVLRWTGVVPDMVQRFERLLPNLNLDSNDELMDLVTSAAQNKNIRERKSVRIALQRHDMSIKESDVSF